jgi:hypothetical protein
LDGYACGSHGASRAGVEMHTGKFATKLSQLHTRRTFDVPYVRPLAMTRHLGNLRYR